MIRLVHASFRAALLGDFVSVSGNTMDGEEVDLLVVDGSMLESQETSNGTFRGSPLTRGSFFFREIWPFFFIPSVLASMSPSVCSRRTLGGETQPRIPDSDDPHPPVDVNARAK
jgi:hypothetical protein